jgi:hypothetical protein
LGHFKFLLKIRGDIRKSRLNHWCQRHRWEIAAGINDTGGKFATGINDTGSKFAAGVVDTGG